MWGHRNNDHRTCTNDGRKKRMDMIFHRTENDISLPHKTAVYTTDVIMNDFIYSDCLHI